MIELQQDGLNVRIDTENWEYLNHVKDHFSHYVEGFRHMPKYKAGLWDGKISMFDSATRTVPYGLALELIKYTKNTWSELPYSLSGEVKGTFTGTTPDYSKDLLFEPYDYQDDCITACLKTSKGIIRSATASGKSLMISYVIKALLEKGEIEKSIIIVPSIGLVTQFYEDMFDYGIDMNLVGRVGEKWKEWDNPIVISTWQSLKNVPERLKDIDAVIVDEVHGAKARVLKDLLTECNARWRFGFTGTMPDSQLECLQVMSYLGPVLREYGSVELAELGYVAHCKINMLNIDYNSYKGKTYNEIKDDVFNKTFRMGIIKSIINKLDDNVLLLVGKVEDEGEVLKKALKEDPQFEGYEIEFLSGKDKAAEREAWRKYVDTKSKIILIATYQIFQQGINMKSLKYLILASPFKSKIRVLQSIGRTLRLHCDKVNGALVWDLCDNVKHLSKHSSDRLRHYTKEGFEIEERFTMEGDVFDDALFEIE